MAKEIEIPEGYEARIEGNKVIFVPKESEDERVRKALIDGVRQIRCKNDITQEQMITYLEKQKDLDKMTIVSPEVWDNAISDAFENGKKEGEKQKEQKPIFKKGDKVIWDDEEFNILDVNETEYNVGGYRVPFSRQNELHPIWQKSAEWSEDEKIRKELLKEIEFITPRDGETDGEGLILPSYHARIDRYKSYLEKQKDQKPAVEQLDGTFNSYDMAKTFVEGQYYVIEHPERFGLCKPVEWSEDWREEDIQTRFAFYTYKDDPSVLYLSNVFVEETSRNHGFGTRILRAAEKVAETIGATTISLKVKQDSPANAWYRKNGYGYVAFEDGYDWLEKNLEYMKPNKQDWSEEDEIYLQDALWCVEKAEKSCKDEQDKGACWSAKRWLKSLRPSWKPSEE